MKRGWLSWFVLVLAVVLVAGVFAGCSTSPEGETNQEGANGTEGAGLSGTLQVNGSTTVTPIAQAWAEAFMDENPDVEVTVIGTGSGDGIAALINGTTDIAMASRKMKDSERADVKSKRGVEPQEFVVGRDALAVIVHPSNPIDSLTMEQIKDIFTGEITNWKDVGGPDAEILVYTRDSSSGTYGFFKEHVLEDEEYASHARTTASNAAMRATVAQEEYAIGYVGLSFLSGVKALGVSKDGGEPVVPSLETVSEYPIVRDLNMYTAGAPEGLTKAFLEFRLSAKGQEIVAEVGYIPVK